MSIELGQLTIKEIKRRISVHRQILLILQRWLALIMENRPLIICHHSGTSRDSTHFSTINYAHYKKKYPRSKEGYYLAYNTLIEGDGKVKKARSYNEAGEATGTFNGFHLDICLTGNFDDETPSKEQLEALNRELKVIEQMYGSYKLGYHGQYYPTACCGKNLIAYVKSQKAFEKK